MISSARSSLAVSSEGPEPYICLRPVAFGVRSSGGRQIELPMMAIHGIPAPLPTTVFMSSAPAEAVVRREGGDYLENSTPGYPPRSMI